MLTADGSFVKYPNGLVITFKRAEVMAPRLASDLQAGQSLVRVTVSAANKGTEPFPLGNERLLMDLYYGADRYRADQDAGFFDSKPPVTSVNPSRIVPGSTVDVFLSWDVPNQDLDELALTVDFAPDLLTMYTFADIGKKLVRSP